MSDPTPDRTSWLPTGSSRLDVTDTGSSRLVPPPIGALRIGDAERDQAVTDLSEHFVAGRLTQGEFEDRSNQATRARYADELSPLFADLPDPALPEPAAKAWHPGVRPDPRRSRPVPPPVFLLMPVLLVGLIAAAVLLSAPGILWLLFWIFIFTGPRHHHHRWQHPHRPHRPEPSGSLRRRALGSPGGIPRRSTPPPDGP